MFNISVGIIDNPNFFRLRSCVCFATCSERRYSIKRTVSWRIMSWQGCKIKIRSNVNFIKLGNIPNHVGSSRIVFPCNISEVKLVSMKKDAGTNCSRFPCKSIDLMPSQQERSASISLMLFSPSFNSDIPLNSITSVGTITSPFLARLMDLKPVES